MTVLGYGYAGKTIVYPNPNDGNLTLSLIHDKDIESVSIVNAIGEIYPINITSSLQQLLTCSIPSNYPNGMYSLIIRSKKGNFSIGSFSLVQ